jgi:hypothetical protein
MAAAKLLNDIEYHKIINKAQITFENKLSCFLPQLLNIIYTFTMLTRNTSHFI